jgi:hypothetical protein
MTKSVLILAVIMVFAWGQNLHAFQAVDDGASLDKIKADIANSNTELLKTHPWLTYQGIKVHEHISNIHVPAKYANEMVYGSVEEDYDAEETSTGNYASLKHVDRLGYPWDSQRAFNHFYAAPRNDTTDTNGGLCADSGTVKGVPAWKWALTDAANDGRENTMNGRQFRAETTIVQKFRALGHVLHLLEDMGVPAHVRNDQHPFDEPYEIFLKKKLFDQYTALAGFTDADQLIAAAVVSNLPGDYSFNRFSDYFKELSDYIQTNYFSSDTVSNESETKSSCGIVIKNPEVEIRTEKVPQVNSGVEVVETFIQYYVNKNSKMRVAAPSVYGVVFQKYYSPEAPRLLDSIMDENCAIDAWQSSAPLIIKNLSGVIGDVYARYLTPEAVSVSPSQNSLKFNWKMPHPSSDGMYRVTRESDGATEVVAATTFSANGLTPAKEYCYQITYVDTEGNGFGTAEMCGTTLNLPSPGLNITAKALTSRRVSVSWSVPGDSSLVEASLVYRNGGYLRTVTGSSFVDTEVSANQTYCYSVATVYKSGDVTGHSCEVCILVPNLVPESLGWEKSYGDSSGTVRWSSVKEASDQGIILNGAMYSTPSYQFFAHYVKLDQYGQFVRALSTGNWFAPMELSDDGGGLLVGQRPDYPGTPLAAKVDQDWNILWENGYDYYRRSLYGSFTSTKQTADGGYLLAGTLYNQGALLLKVSRNGAPEWEKIYPEYQGTFFSSFKLLQRRQDGKFLAVGSDSGLSSVLVLDANGTILKSLVQIDSEVYPNGDDSIFISNDTDTLRITPDGGFVVGGYFANNIEYYGEAMLTKYDANGNQQWQKHIPDPGYIRTLEVTNDGGYIFVLEGDSSKIVRADSAGIPMWTVQRNDVKFSSAQQTSDGGFLFLDGAGTNLAHLLKLDVSGNYGTSDLTFSCTTSTGGSTDGPPVAM